MFGLALTVAGTVSCGLSRLGSQLIPWGVRDWLPFVGFGRQIDIIRNQSGGVWSVRQEI